MAVYIALLKGINVGKSRRIKMDSLNKLLEKTGLKRLETYIQSGNLVFESEENDDIVRRKIEEGIYAEFGFAPVVIIRTAAELEKLIKGCPYTENEISTAEEVNAEGESFYVDLLAAEPGAETTVKLEALRTENDDFRIDGRDVYILLKHSIRNSKMAVALQRLLENSTVRNWKTMIRLNEMAGKHK